MRKEVIGDCTLYLGDCREILPTIQAESVDAVITDPPYGIKYKPLRGSNGSKMWGNRAVLGDDEPFDPKPIVDLCVPTIIWGANNFADKLPASGGWLVWDKTSSGVRKGFVYSHCELAWTNITSRVHKFSLNWQGSSRDGEGFHHPTQKSIKLMSWCVSLIENASVVFDPYMGSGTTAIACAIAGRGFVGCELDVEHFDTACKRIEKAYEQKRTPLFEAV